VLQPSLTAGIADAAAAFAAMYGELGESTP
jgi:hypothetical protein